MKRDFIEVGKILKGSLDLIPSPSNSVKIQITSGKVCLRCKGKPLLGTVKKLLKQKSLLTSPCSNIALPLDSLLLHGVSAGPCFCLQARRRKHARRHACPRDSLKQGQLNKALLYISSMIDVNFHLKKVWKVLIKNQLTKSDTKMIRR